YSPRPDGSFCGGSCSRQEPKRGEGCSRLRRGRRDGSDVLDGADRNLRSRRFRSISVRGIVLDLGPIYRWAERHGYEVNAEHIMIAGIPVQVIPAPTELAAEA